MTRSSGSSVRTRLSLGDCPNDSPIISLTGAAGLLTILGQQ